MPALSEREQRRHRYSIIRPDYLCAELWNRFVFVCGFFWSDRSLWKTSFMALASESMATSEHSCAHPAMLQLYSAQTGCVGFFYIQYIFIIIALNCNGLSAPFYDGNILLRFRPLILLCCCGFFLSPPLLKCLLLCFLHSLISYSFSSVKIKNSTSVWCVHLNMLHVITS